MKKSKAIRKKTVKRDATPRDPLAIKAGERIRYYREHYYEGQRPDPKMTLEELSKNVHGILSDRRISNYEQGIRLISPHEALILGKALGASAAYLLCVAEEDELTKEELRLLRNWRALPEKARNRVLKGVCAEAAQYLEPAPQEKVDAAYPRVPDREKEE